MSHSLKNFRDSLFLYKKIMFGLLFFPFIFGMIFFFRKSLPSLTHSIEKRVYGFFTHSLDFAKKSQKKLFPGKKTVTLTMFDGCFGTWSYYSK